MSNRRLTLVVIACSAIGFIAGSGTALARFDYPNKPVKVIVPFPAGGTSDVIGRPLAEELVKILKQHLIVESPLSFPCRRAAPSPACAGQGKLADGRMSMPCNSTPTPRNSRSLGTLKKQPDSSHFRRQLA